MTSPYYYVDLTAGPYSWVTESTDPASVYGLADPLVVAWALPEDGLALSHPAPMQASFRVVVEDIANFSDLGIGTAVSLSVYDCVPGTPDPLGGSIYTDRPPLVRFRGRIASLAAQPHKRGGMLIAASCVDYTVDLSESTVGLTDWPAEVDWLRQARIFAEAGEGTAFTFNYDAPLAARAAARSDARTQMLRVIDTAVQLDAGSRSYLTPNYSGVGDADEPNPTYRFAVIGKPTRTRGDNDMPSATGALAGRFVLLPSGKWGIEPSQGTTDLPSRIFDADLIDFKSSWALLKNDRPDTVTVTTTAATFSDVAGTAVTEQTADAVPVTLALDTDLTQSTYARALALMNLTDHDSDNWTADEFTFYADRDPDTVLYPMPLFNDAEIARVAWEHAVIAGIPAEQNPAGHDWYAGMLSGAKFTLAKGRYTVGLQLRRNVLRSYGNATGLTCANVNTVGSVLSCNDLDRSFSSYDYRIARNPAYV